MSRRILAACGCLAVALVFLSAPMALANDAADPSPTTPSSGAVATETQEVREVSPEQRAAADAYFLMMSQMQGLSATNSPVVRALEARGIKPAPMGGYDLSNEPGGSSHGGMHGESKPTIWSAEEYYRQYNKLGTTPPVDGYQQYVQRMKARLGLSAATSGESMEPSGHAAMALDSAERMADRMATNHAAHGTGDGEDHMSHMVASLGMPGATIKRGRDDKAPPVEVEVLRPGQFSNLEMRSDRIKSFDVAAIRKDIVYTRFGDHDKDGMLFVLQEDKARVQACQGFECGHDPLFFGSRTKDANALSPQPLVIRANVGDIVRINLTNETDDQRVSMHIHKAIYNAANSAGSSAGFNPDTTVGPGETISYLWRIPPHRWAEGIYYFYSHSDPRFQVPHGLFGALIVEPLGSSYFDTETGEPMKAGWGAIINNERPEVEPFREYVVIFQDRIELETASGQQPIDIWTGVPDAGGKGISYRSAPFFNMMNLFLDESMAYSAYTFGDYSTPHPRWYIGDRMRVRVVHGGSGEHHVFHNHAHRWRVNPQEEVVNLDEPTKGGERDRILSKSTRIDSQTMGPGEVFDVEMEGGAGGVQRTVGDVLFHCHIIEHVIEGMWSYHRIYNTLQDDLAPLPERRPPPRAVNSVELLRRARDGNPAIIQAGGRFFGQELTDDNLREWITWLLPPAGVPEEELIIDPEHGNRTQNKSNRLDWTFAETPEGPLALNEPNDWFFGPGFPALGEGVGVGTPGERPEFLFNPEDGRLAYPQLKPHLGRRPPFAPIRDGNPDLQGTAYLGLQLPDGAFGDSGAEYGSGLIPEKTHSTLVHSGEPTEIRRYDIRAIELPIEYNEFGDVDPNGMIFALAGDVPEIRAGSKPAEPLVLRAGVGEGVQIRLASQLPDDASVDYHSKVGMHIHLVQYDVQSSDGAVAGFNYETSVRPSMDASGAPIEGRKACGVWDPRDCGPLDRSDEVIHTTWFADVELGTSYWHDHSKLIISLPHGLFGALIVEPEAAVYRDRETGLPLYVADEEGRLSSTSGQTGTQMADIVMPSDIVDPRTGEKRDDFREFFFGQGDAVRLHGFDLNFAALEHGESRRNPEKGFAYLNNRAEPFSNRLKVNSDPSLVYSSFIHGDPTPSSRMFRAYVGDPVTLRIEGGGTNSVHPFQMHGHRWLFQRGDFRSSVLRDFVVNGVSEAFSFDLAEGAGGVAGAEGDYLYYDADMDHRTEGAWGIFRVHDTARTDLEPLPDRTAPPAGVGFPEREMTRELVDGRPPQPLGEGSTGAPADAPVRRYEVVAIDKAIHYDSFGTADALGKIFVLASDEAAVRSGAKPTEPLCIRANAGEVIEVELRNGLAAGRVGLHASLVGYDVAASDGSAVGYNPDSTVGVGETRTYRWYADQALGTVYLYNPASLDDTRHGLFGGLFVQPAGSTWSDPVTGGPLEAGCAADVFPGDGSDPFREYGIFFHDGADQIRYRVAVNYRTARRRGANEVLPGGPGGVVPDEREPTVHDSRIWGDPVTPVLRAYHGDRVIVRLLQPAYEDHHVFHLHGHSWFLEPGDIGSQRLSNITLSVGTTYDVELIGGARAGDHPFHCHIMDHKKMGMWGLMRVYNETQSDLMRLNR